ncbi:hypothetical protein CL658_03045 [bacterium]|nr:hypothetical protein [bacterium]|tara:strand:- start:539 stop:1477 length:939 start_codon:yes stop_codon:yes gene_type:complete
MQHNLPPGIAIIQSVVKQLDTVQSFLKDGSEENKLLKTVLKESLIMDHDSRFLDNALFITYIQMLLLAGMSMFGGVSLSCLNSFSDHDDRVSLTWDSGVSDSFTWGIYDESFLQFISYYQDRLSSKPQHRKHLPSEIIIGIRGFFSTYLDILGSLDFKIKDLLMDKSSFLTIVSSELNKDALFLVISSLPSEQLSRFFMFLYPFLPSDLMVTSPDGRSMTLSAMFDQPSYDFSFLSEKMKLFLDLYFNSQLPKIQMITQDKTAEFLSKVIQNDHDFNVTQDNIKSVKQSQIDVRKTLYGTLKNHLDELVYVS